MWIKTWWPALLVVGIVIALWAYEKYIRHDEREAANKDTKIEKLENESATNKEVREIRKKQNEVLVRDITPSDFDNILQQHRF